VGGDRHSLFASARRPHPNPQGAVPQQRRRGVVRAATIIVGGGEEAGWPVTNNYHQKKSPFGGRYLLVPALQKKLLDKVNSTYLSVPGQPCGGGDQLGPLDNLHSQ
jgi:hypothetical protein